MNPLLQTSAESGRLMGILIGCLVAIGVIAVPFVMVRLSRRLGGSTVSAGPATAHFPPPPGQEQIPWELHSIAMQLPRNPTGVVGPQLIYTANRLIDSAGLTSVGHLPTNATVGQLQLAITMLENHLGIEPLYHGVHLPASLPQGTPT